MHLQTIKTKRLYIQVAEQISKLVRDGNIKTGDKLPAERELAEKLGVSRPTIREAMIALELQGIVEIRTGSGIYILEQKPELTLRDEGVIGELAPNWVSYSGYHPDVTQVVDVLAPQVLERLKEMDVQAALLVPS